MSSIAETLNIRGNGWWIAVAGIAAMIIVANTIPHLQRSRTVANQAQEAVLPRPVAGGYQSTSSADKLHTAGRAFVSTALLEPAAVKGTFDSAMDRKMVRSSSVDLVVQHPAEAAEKIRLLAERQGGFLVSSNVNGGPNAAGGSITIRVPAEQFEAAWAEICRLGLRVESEKIDAQDVTRQYVDQNANLRNLRGEELQYLGILKQARTVKDMLEVSEKLAGVRGQIEQQQAEFDALSKQVETVAISISLRSEAEAQVFGLHWRPLYQLKLALRDGLDAVAGYAAVMTSIVFYLPAVLLWMGTMVVGGAVGWRIVRWARQRFFDWPRQSAVQNG
jgi:hypothetical protein